MMASQNKDTKNQYVRTRKDHSSEIAEDYVEAISEIIASNGECRLIELARRFQVTHVTANRTIGRLKRDGLVESEPYGPSRSPRMGIDRPGLMVLFLPMQGCLLSE